MFRLFRNEVNKIVEITKENAELNRGAGDMLVAFTEAKHGRKHMSLKNGNPTMSLCLKYLYDLIEENKSLIKQLNDSLKQP